MSSFAKIVIVLSLATSLCALKPVNIGKCCKYNEYLAEGNLCVKNESSYWDIRIYNGKQKKFENNHTLPSHWKLREEMRPNCSNPHRISYHGTNYFPFLNGSLYSIDYDRLIHPNQFCLDYKSILICIPHGNESLAENITHVIVKKCCGQNAIFTQSNRTCRAFKDEKNTYKIDIGPGKTMGAGFPHCEDNSMRVVGDLDKSRIFDNGSILVHNYLLPATSYCLEHILEHNSG